MFDSTWRCAYACDHVRVWVCVQRVLTYCPLENFCRLLALCVQRTKIVSSNDLIRRNACADVGVRVNLFVAILQVRLTLTVVTAAS